MKREFASIVSKNEGIILKVSRMYCNNKEDCEDLFQDIVYQLWRAYPSFKKESKVSTWIYRVSLNTVISRLRKEAKKDKRVDIDLADLQISHEVVR